MLWSKAGPLEEMCTRGNTVWLLANAVIVTLGCGTGSVAHQWNLLQRSSDTPRGQGHREEALGVSVRYGGHSSVVGGTAAIPSTPVSVISECVCMFANVWVLIVCRKCIQSVKL